MDAQQFLTAVSALSDDDFQKVLNGSTLVVVQDRGLRLGKTDDAFVIYELGEDPFDTVASLKQYLIDNVEDLLRDYYQFNPISKEFFQARLRELMLEHGEAAFAAQPNNLPEKAVFVEQGELVCEGQESPRFKYGLYLRLDEAMPAMAVSNKVKNWLQSGSAYGDYISVNVCRFSAF
ncbi:hypothetical protein [Hydrogenovibrio thermophilus]|uniref:Uncharacterized protein n=1 Tax=Hydrogenovibrio thermophilus TaxID=265883 RepID=A0A451G591_9GAMM|nr:hypothetical protein [Hydrogenovibrio thermophilus]QAB14669.1 hypothetical protein EPV75_02785 [Hydrogenovibrio thermophilus]